MVLQRVDGHAVVANSAAMKAAGVTAATAAPSGGRIESGLFVDNAVGLIGKAVPPPTDAELDQALAKSQEILLGYGVTAVGSMSTSIEDWRAFRRAGEAGTLNVRLMAYLLGPEDIAASEAPTPWLFDDHLARSDEASSRTARWGRGGHGSSNPMPTCRTREGCNSIRMERCARLPT